MKSLSNLLLIFLFAIPAVNTGFAQNVGIGTTTPNSNFEVNGSVGQKVRTITANTTLSAADAVILCQATAPLTVTLPGATAIKGRTYTIKNIGNYPVTIACTGAEMIDPSLTSFGYLGSSTYRGLSSANNVVKLISDGANWFILEEKISGFYLGEHYGGGVIAYIDSTGQHGLVMAPETNHFEQWSPGVYSVTGANGTAVGTGQSNTTKIVAALGAGNYAAMYCDTYTAGGFSDWYLPSKAELDSIYANRSFLPYLQALYWTSTEVNDNSVWVKSFDNGASSTLGKFNNQRFIPVRSF